MLTEVKAAAERLKGVAKVTPLDFSKSFSRLSGNDVFLKMENLQLTGSFKIRGAYNKILSLLEEDKRRGIIAASAGNHAQGVAYSATLAKIPATIVMPRSASLVKVVATRSYGAKVILHGANFDEALAYAQQLQRKKGYLFIHPYDDEQIIAGQGTVGLEILKQLPSVQAVLVPIGGGGLISGIASAIKALRPSVRIIGVQAIGADAMYRSFMALHLTATKTSSTIADGIAIKHPGKRTFAYIRKYVDDIVLVDDDEISSTIMHLLERAKLVVEPAGAVALAALLHKKVPFKKKKVVAVLTGGNIDIKTLDSIIRRGLIKEGRSAEFRTVLSDKPGELQKLLKLIAEQDANIISIDHNRVRPHTQIGSVDVNLILETRDDAHSQAVLRMLKKHGYEVMLHD